MVQTGAASGIAYPLCPARQDVERTDTATRGIVPHDTTRAHDSNAARVPISRQGESIRSV